MTLVGRTRQITEENKTDIYSILPKICVSPTDMIDTVFAGKISRMYCHLKKKVPTLGPGHLPRHYQGTLTKALTKTL